MSGMLAAGFWNYLREDITFSLFEHCQLKMDLERIPPSENALTDQDHLNAITLILGHIINVSFTGTIDAIKLAHLNDTVKNWRLQLPARFKPFSTASESSTSAIVLPTIWMLQDCHGKSLLNAQVAKRKRLTHVQLQHCTINTWRVAY